MKLKNEKRIDILFEELVPAIGKADNLAGELIRAVCRIGHRFYNDGDQIGIGLGNETCNPPARFLIAMGGNKIADVTKTMWVEYSEEDYEKKLDILLGAVADLVENTPQLRAEPTEDMWNFRDMEKDVPSYCWKDDEYI